MKHESCGFFCFLFLLIFPCLFFPTLFAESRMQRRYLHVATWIIRFFWSRPESAFFKVFPGHSWILQWNPDTMNQSLAQLCCKKHPRLSPGLGGTSCSSLAGNLLLIPGRKHPWDLALSAWAPGRDLEIVFEKKNQFYLFALLISIHLSGFDVHLHSLLKP